MDQRKLMDNANTITDMAKVTNAQHTLKMNCPDLFMRKYSHDLGARDRFNRFDRIVGVRCKRKANSLRTITAIHANI